MYKCIFQHFFSSVLLLHCMTKTKLRETDFLQNSLAAVSVERKPHPSPYLPVIYNVVTKFERSATQLVK